MPERVTSETAPVEARELAALRMVAAAAVADQITGQAYDRVRAIEPVDHSALSKLYFANNAARSALQEAVTEYRALAKPTLEERIKTFLSNLDERAAAVVERGGDAEC